VLPGALRWFGCRGERRLLGCATHYIASTKMKRDLCHMAFVVFITVSSNAQSFCVSPMDSWFDVFPLQPSVPSSYNFYWHSEWDNQLLFVRSTDSGQVECLVDGPTSSNDSTIVWSIREARRFHAELDSISQISPPRDPTFVSNRTGESAVVGNATLEELLSILSVTPK
jgi:hypothetical protein